jgi:hypothetical protein
MEGGSPKTAADRPRLVRLHHAERDDGVGVAVYDRDHVRAEAIDFAVNEPFEINRSAGCSERVAVEIEFQNVRGCHQRRRHAASEQEAVRPLVVPDADMPERIDHILVVKDMVRCHKVGDKARIRCGRIRLGVGYDGGYRCRIAVG